MENGERKINNVTFALMLTLAGIVDLIQFAIGFLDVIFIGTPINWLLIPFIWLTFYIWFKIKGVSFVKPKRGLLMGAAPLIEMIPLINMLPAWTLAVVLIVGSERAEELLQKAGVVAGGVVAKKQGAPASKGGAGMAGKALPNRPKAMGKAPRV